MCFCVCIEGDAKKGIGEGVREEGGQIQKVDGHRSDCGCASKEKER